MSLKDMLDGNVSPEVKAMLDRHRELTRPNLSADTCSRCGIPRDTGQADCLKCGNCGYSDCGDS